MAKIKSSSRAARGGSSGEKFQFPLRRTNYLILLAGVAMLAAGFIFMAIPDDPDAFMTLTLAPILLVVSFLVVIPLGILYRPKEMKDQGK